MIDACPHFLISEIAPGVMAPHTPRSIRPWRSSDPRNLLSDDLLRAGGAGGHTAIAVSNTGNAFLGIAEPP
jgi:hypothetical protein